jgi:hypothetical protein
VSNGGACVLSEIELNKYYCNTGVTPVVPLLRVFQRTAFST